MKKIRHVSFAPSRLRRRCPRVKQRCGADGDLLSISLVQIIHLPRRSLALPFSDRIGGEETGEEEEEEDGLVGCFKLGPHRRGCNSLRSEL